MTPVDSGKETTAVTVDSGDRNFRNPSGQRGISYVTVDTGGFQWSSSEFNAEIRKLHDYESVDTLGNSETSVDAGTLLEIHVTPVDPVFFFTFQ